METTVSADQRVGGRMKMEEICKHSKERQMTANTRRNLLRRAANLVVVDDGAYRWVGSRSEVYGWLAAHDIDRTSNSAALNSEQYQALCDATTCYVDTSGSYGPSGVDPYELIDAISDAGADHLYIR